MITQEQEIAKIIYPGMSPRDLAKRAKKKNTRDWGGCSSDFLVGE
jgi:hypothetical protein